MQNLVLNLAQIGTPKFTSALNTLKNLPGVTITFEKRGNPNRYSNDS